MNLLRILLQDWLKKIRTRGFYKNLTVSLLLGFAALYFVVIFFALGMFLHNILIDISPEKIPTEFFNGLTLYLLLGGLAVRYMMQQLTTVNIQSYQILPIKRSAIVNYILFKPFLNPINYIIFFTIIPFAIRSVSVDYNGFTAFCFVLNFFLIVCFNSLMASFIKRKFGSNFWGFLGVIAFFGIVIAAEIFHFFSLFAVSKIIFNFIVLKPGGLVPLLCAAASAYFLNRWFFSQNFYAEKFEKQAKTEKTYKTENLSFLNRFGIVGEIMALEMKLVWRHKRTKTLLYMTPFMLCFGLIYYTNNLYGQGMRFVWAVFMTGIITFFFGQWLISWNSSHFDSLMTRNLPVRSYLSANLYLMLAGNILCFLLTMPYFLLGKEFVILHIAAFLYNSGVNTFLLTYFAAYNTKRIDLSARSAMNYQGTTFKNFLIMIPLMLFPMAVVGLFSLFSKTNIALIALSVLGIVGLLFQKQLISLCVNQFNRRKYVLCEGFRQTE
ncbi:MAG: DUF5687 family protein [Lentimicrobiaceae bacterium]|nr:DUF5687 family protein [Lentimicrobiaceae bacterium]